jgi:hypothetical protein
VADDKITFQCSCGQAMAAKAEHAGMKAKCPACAKIVTIPGGSRFNERIAAQPVPRPKAAARAADDYDDEEESPRPRGKKRKKKSVVPWIIAGVAVLLLVVGGTVGAIIFLRGSGGSDLDFVPGNAQVVVVARVADLVNGEVGKKLLAEVQKNSPDPNAEMVKKFGFALTDIERIAVVITDMDSGTGYAVLTGVKPFDRQKILSSSSTPAVTMDHAGKSYDVITGVDMPFQRLGLYFVSSKVLLAGPETGVQQALNLLGSKKKPTGPLDLTLQRAAEKHLMVVGFSPPPAFVQGVKAGAAGAPIDITPLYATQAATMIVDGDSKWDMELILSYPDDAKAKLANEIIAGTVAAAKLGKAQVRTEFTKKFPPLIANNLATQYEKILDATKATLVGPNVNVAISIDIKGIMDDFMQLGKQMMGGMMPGLGGAGPPGGGRPGAFPPGGGAVPPGGRFPPGGGAPRGGRMPPGGGGGGNPGGRPIPGNVNPPGVGLNPGGNNLVDNIRGAAQGQKHSNNLKQIALAFLLYADAHGGQLPPAVIYSKDGKPLYSWRVELLPYIEEQQLYNEFHKDEPWDSPHNKTLLARIPKAFTLPGAPASNRTAYQVFVGPNTPWIGDGRNGPRMPASFPDGTSNTILVAEAMSEVEWTKPADITLGPGKNPRLLLGHHVHNAKCFVAMADGSVRTINITAISDKTLKNAIDPADGEMLGPDFGN